jgi:hypothetical protein
VADEPEVEASQIKQEPAADPDAYKAFEARLPFQQTNVQTFWTQLV